MLERRTGRERSYSPCDLISVRFNMQHSMYTVVHAGARNRVCMYVQKKSKNELMHIVLNDVQYTKFISQKIVQVNSHLLFKTLHLP